jgi:uncharacterized protein YdhG (YjbR/CyaY superfamily)
MAWVKVPPENRPKFHAALPRDPRVETVTMFGGIAAKVNGRLFAGLFGRSTMLSLSEADRTAALALPGASAFDPMGNGKVRSDKVMLPDRMMDAPAELRHWIARAFEATEGLPQKGTTMTKAPKPARRATRSMAGKTKTIDEYLATVGSQNRAALEKLRKTIRSIVPKAEECISYGMPAFRLDGVVVAGFLATAKGGSYYPFSGSTLKGLAKDVADYGQTKGAIHFSSKGLPPALVGKLIRARIAEVPKRKRKAGGRRASQSVRASRPRTYG